MKKLVSVLAVMATLPVPAAAADWRVQQEGVRASAFAGARLRIPLGGEEAKRKLSAQLAIAPALSKVSNDGFLRTQAGQGLALNISPKSKPTLTLHGIRADHALGLQAGGRVNAKRKHGISTAGWIAIGVGTAAIAFGAYYLAWLDCQDEPCDEDSGECRC